MRFWNVGDGNTRVVVDGYRPTPMIPLGWSPDGNTIAYRRGDGSDWFLDTALGKPAVRAFEQPSICGWSTTGECVLSGSSYGDLGRAIPERSGHEGTEAGHDSQDVPTGTHDEVTSTALGRVLQ